MTSIKKENRILIVKPSGRLDSFGSKELQSEIDAAMDDSVLCSILDLAFVDYLSSAGVRVLMMLGKKMKSRSGLLALSNVQSYCRQVIKMAGFSDTFPEFQSLPGAVRHCNGIVRDQDLLAAWDEMEVIDTPIGSMRFVPGIEEPGSVEVLGDIQDVIHSRISVNHLCSKKFSETEYSIGLGGLGDRIEDYYPIMGEMITVGGTMVWLPTDGHDTADFLIPQKDSGDITIRTGFNASVSGPFNETVYFKSNNPKGATITEIYRTLFDLARDRRSDFLGGLGLAMRAEMAAVFGSGIRKSPVENHMPENGKPIIDPSNFGEWFEIDKEPRHSGVTGLLCGVGVDLNSDLSGYDRLQLGAAFYMNPGNPGASTQMLHNHGVFFSPIPMPSQAVNVDTEIQKVVQDGDFVDMRHMLDDSTVTTAVIGICYIQQFRRDPRGQQGV